jgi:soluble lytic murein transglycosylase-like protein
VQFVTQRVSVPGRQAAPPLAGFAARLAIPCLLAASACVPAASTFLRATGPVPEEEAAVPGGEAGSPVAANAREAAADSPVEALPRDVEVPRGDRRREESMPAPGRRAAASFPYVPRRVACTEIVRIAREVAARTGLEAGLLIGVMRVESAFTTNAISPAAAVGLSQVMPSNGERLGCGDLFEPVSNVTCGATVLARWLDRFQGNLVSALSGYNAGHSMPTRAREEHRTPRNFQYVEDVLRARSRFLRQGCRAFDETAAR